MAVNVVVYAPPAAEGAINMQVLHEQLERQVQQTVGKLQVKYTRSVPCPLAVLTDS